MLKMINRRTANNYRLTDKISEAKELHIDE